MTEHKVQAKLIKGIFKLERWVGGAMRIVYSGEYFHQVSIDVQ